MGTEARLRPGQGQAGEEQGSCAGAEGFDGVTVGHQGQATGTQRGTSSPAGRKSCSITWPAFLPTQAVANRTEQTVRTRHRKTRPKALRADEGRLVGGPGIRVDSRGQRELETDKRLPDSHESNCAWREKFSHCLRRSILLLRASLGAVPKHNVVC